MFADAMISMGGKYFAEEPNLIDIEEFTYFFSKN